MSFSEVEQRSGEEKRIRDRRGGTFLVENMLVGNIFVKSEKITIYLNFVVNMVGRVPSRFFGQNIFRNFEKSKVA